MSYAEDGEYDKMYDLLDKDSQKGISKKEFIKRNKVSPGFIAILFL